MVPINLYDTIWLRPSPDGQLRLNCRVAQDLRPRLSASQDAARVELRLPPTAQNLAYRAMERVIQARPEWQPVETDLVKRIPSEAGLGGASSDAAATMVAECQLAELQGRTDLPTTSEWCGWAAELGSDVPFFFARRGAWCRGRGERVELVRVLPRLDFVLVKPDEGLATPEVYRHVEVPREPRSGATLLEALQHRRLQRAGRLLFNRLEAAADCVTDWIKRIREVFERTDVLGHQMSGSGTSYFALCRSRLHAARIARQIRSRRIGSVYAVHSLQHPRGGSVWSSQCKENRNGNH